MNDNTAVGKRILQLFCRKMSVRCSRASALALNQALAIINSRKESRVAGTYYLACGFEPLHLATLFRAHLLEHLPNDQNVEVRHGVYGDLRGNIESAAGSSAAAAAVVLEWSDLDPRLGLRRSGGWSNEAKADIIANCLDRYTHLATAIQALAAQMPVALAPPRPPLPPIRHTIRAQSSVLELFCGWWLITEDTTVAT